MAKELTDVGENEWQLYGRCLDLTSSTSDCGSPITLPEQSSRLGMRAHTPLSEYTSKIDKDSFGKPIDANLAIYLMANAIKATNQLFSQMLHGVDEKDKDDFEALANNLYNIAYGVTFDKTIILKILSQPNCEGLRSYLCARKVDCSTLPHFSLVMVGVDINGFDLNYPPATYPPVGLDGKLVADDNAGGNQSLSGEYGNPPGGKGLLNFDSDDTNEHYFLLAQAKKLAGSSKGN
jgi:hypothetical protein